MQIKLVSFAACHGDETISIALWRAPGSSKLKEKGDNKLASKYTK
jgi:hypothetical protein